MVSPKRLISKALITFPRFCTLILIKFDSNTTKHQIRTASLLYISMIKQEKKKRKKPLTLYSSTFKAKRISFSYKKLLKRLEIYGSKSIKTQQSPLLYRILNPQTNHTFNFSIQTKEESLLYYYWTS